MSLVVSCQCGQSFAALPSLAGQTLPCPACGRPLTVPWQPVAPLPMPPRPLAPTPTFITTPASADSGLSPLLKIVIGCAAGVIVLLGCVIVGREVFARLSKEPALAAKAELIAPAEARTAPELSPPVPRPADLPGIPLLPEQSPLDGPRAEAFPEIPPQPPQPLVKAPETETPPPAPAAPPPDPRMLKLPGNAALTMPDGIDWKLEKVAGRKEVERAAITCINGQVNGRLFVEVLETDGSMAQAQRSVLLKRKSEQMHAEFHDRMKGVQGSKRMQLSGLGLNGRVPDNLFFSFSVDVNGVQSFGGGRIHFGQDRVHILEFTADDGVTLNNFQSLLATFRAL